MEIEKTVNPKPGPNPLRSPTRTPLSLSFPWPVPLTQPSLKPGLTQRFTSSTRGPSHYLTRGPASGPTLPRAQAAPPARARPLHPGLLRARDPAARVALSLTAPRAHLPASSPPRRARANGQPQRPPEIPATFPTDPHAEDPRDVAFLNPRVTPLHPIHPTRRPANPSRRLTLLHRSRARCAAAAMPSRCVPGPATPHHSFISGPGNSPRPPLPTPWPARTGICPRSCRR